MLGKFKGFNVPRRNPHHGKIVSNYIGTNPYCYATRTEDCQDCEFCLFSKCREENLKAFQEWHKAKGKVKYDEN